MTTDSCLPLLREYNKREELIQFLVDAAESAWAKGANEIALDTFVNVRDLLADNPWERDPQGTFTIYRKLAE
jgi:hypothetical protein